MRVAVLSDIHANFQALKAVVNHIQSWKPDRVIVAGDIVNRGPRPFDCLDYILEKVERSGWHLIRGNHEDYVISWSSFLDPYFGREAEIHQASGWTFHQLKGDVSALISMPYQYSLWDPGGGEIRIVHASMRGNRDGIYPETKRDDLVLKLGRTAEMKHPAVFCVGHTHRPLIRKLVDELVVNAGSAGLPFDGNVQPSYAQLSYQNNYWYANIVRVDYDINLAIKDFYQTDYLNDAGPLSQLVLIELREARSLLYYWATTYHHRVKSGELTMGESVQEFMKVLI